MDIQGQVGETAGKVWLLLNSGGPQTLAQLKRKVKEAGDVVGFAVGWLSREDKVGITKDKNSFRIQLK